MRQGLRDTSEEEIGDSSAERALFGGKLRYDLGFNRHEGAVLSLSLWQAAKMLPDLVAEVLRLAYEADARALRRVAASELFQGISTATILLGTNESISALLVADIDSPALRSALPFVIVVALAVGFRTLASAISRAYLGRLEPKIERVATVRYLERVIRVELSSIEDPDFHRLLDSAQHGASSARRVLMYCGAIANALITFLAVAAVLATLNPILLLLLALLAVPRSWSALWNARARYLSAHAWIEHARAAKLLSALLIDQHSASEIRVHDAGQFLLDQYGKLARSSEEEQARLANDAARTQVFAAVMVGVTSILTYGVLGGFVLYDVMKLATVGTVIIAVRMGTTNLSILMTQANSLYESALYVGDLRRLCEEAEYRAVQEGGEKLDEVIDRIIFEKVNFKYPGADRSALLDVDLTIPKGSVVALVGENGSGKSTLVKLLAGLYKADSGSVRWGGIDVSNADRRDLQSRIAMVAQDFKRWPFTARANVVISRAGAAVDHVRLQEAAAHSGAEATIKELPQGWDTLLAREYYGGHGISGGQWQRLGIARARYRDAPILIVDEPTSALDARAEAEVFERILKQKREDQTVVLVTHRLASVRTADLVYVLKDGRVIESGSPDQLLASEGLFAELFSIQANAYSLES
ncbi:ABC transporter ATP-binding protein [Streptomyces sp. HD]|uniref:ABC transporter ATP-binding protein n=1 Tax=Streptomyces sp. HD TaxID=3020892 RepID=UPI00232EB8DC|nr:ABC transporter ATP-binding protein [Streptomyces sp. HD]MDC0772864.1 ABC transporter ATP-binding protein [Streptomyces sp. HD]